MTDSYIGKFLSSLNSEITNEKANFQEFLKFIFKDLKSKSENSKNYDGICKGIFAGYLDLPINITDKIFEAFRNSKFKVYIDEETFLWGMVTLYSDCNEDSLKLFLEILSFTKNEKVYKQDVKLFITYLIENIQAKDEGNKIIDKFFDRQEYFDYENFIKKIYNNDSDLFMLIYFLLCRKKPFSQKSLKYFSKIYDKLEGSHENHVQSHDETNMISTFFETKIDGNSDLNCDIHPPSLEFKIYLHIYFGFKFEKDQRKRNTIKNNFNSNEIIDKHLYDYEKYDMNNKIKSENFKRGKLNKNLTLNLNKINITPNQEIFPNSKTSCEKELNQNIQNDDLSTDSSIDYNQSKAKQSVEITQEKIETQRISIKKFYTGVIKYSMIEKSEAFHNFTTDEHDDLYNRAPNNLSCDSFNLNDVEEIFAYKYIREKLIEFKIILIENDIFEFILSPDENQCILKTIRHLSGNFVTCCKKEEIENNSFFPLGFLTQYGNTLANIKNIYLFKTENERQILFKKISNILNIRDINDEYDFILDIGKGNFGTVTLGIQKETKEKVAIKSIDKEKLTENDYCYIRREIDILRFLKKFNHKNLIKMVDIYEDKSKIYIITEYMQGGNFSSYLNSKIKMLSEESLNNFFMQIVEGISFLHKNGIIHRDLKLDNILLSDKSLSPNLKIMDFGLSKVFGVNEKANECLGTLVYSAPEMLVSNDYDFPVDIWSFGVILFYIFSERLPFDDKGKCTKIIAKKICSKKPDYSLLKCSRKLKNIIKKCLKKIPHKRPTIDQIEL
jgi:tRNA A-37 threonylcarbamoyl transferase component Bud32